ncbi:DUF4189 domain-containing protein [Luteibacter anthropi]|uniref:DUF4189 domain-containing protein n=1 Tax=Luteibacter anthropi TaxID=564369 RepID=UPI003CCD465F
MASAEGGCPPGQYPQQGPGWQACVPIPGYDTEPTPSQKPLRYISQWISFAVDVDSGGFGVSSDSSSRESAIRTAISDCHAAGGRSCATVGTALNACMAISQGDEKFWLNSDVRKEKAVSKSLDDCKLSDKNCSLHYAGCASPIIVN